MYYTKAAYKRTSSFTGAISNQAHNGSFGLLQCQVGIREGQAEETAWWKSLLVEVMVMRRGAQGVEPWLESTE